MSFGRLTDTQSNRKWVVMDASGQTLGRFATKVAHILRGKDKPTFRPNVDDGNGVIVVNAAEIRVTGRKLEQKMYFRHSGYPGGIKQTRLDEMLARRPDRVIRHAVRGMLPKTSLGRNALRRLRVYGGPEHPHEAQRPEMVEA